MNFKIFKLINLVMIITGVALFTGCSSMKNNYRPEVSLLSKPPLDNINTAYVGDSLLMQGKKIKHEALLLTANVDFGLFKSFTLTNGYYLKQGDDSSADYFLPSRDADSGQIIKSPLADPFLGIKVLKNSSSLCVMTIYVSVCNDNVPYQLVNKDIVSIDSFQQTLLYSGKIGNKINIGYREFSGNLARPAFSNEVEYDLSESKIIGYKGAKVEIIEATNEYLKYKVIKNFNSTDY